MIQNPGTENTGLKHVHWENNLATYLSIISFSHGLIYVIYHNLLTMLAHYGAMKHVQHLN